MKATLRARSGLTLIEVMLVTFVLVMIALVFTATFPTSQISRMKATHLTYATSLAQQKVEELRSAGYSQVMVGSPIETQVAELPGGVQRVSITQYAANVKKIEVAITWAGYRKVGGTSTMVTFLSDHS
ncbi:MAG: type IV pilus modification PilV family protein [Armatimonadota bacterium]